MIFAQLRNAREPRVFQPLEIPNVQVRVDDRKIRHLKEIPNANGPNSKQDPTPGQNELRRRIFPSALRALSALLIIVGLERTPSRSTVGTMNLHLLCHREKRSGGIPVIYCF